MNAPTLEIQAAEVAREVDGPVLLPGDEDFARETSAFNINAVMRPALVVGATGARDVQAAVSFADRHGLPVAVRGAGHQVVQAGAGAVLVNTSRMDDVAIDAAARVARVGAGARWHDVVEAAARVGLAPMNGSAPSVGVVGYTLGGGQSPVLGRSLGYAADHVRRVEIVTADGALRTASAETEPDLFWAVRGGKGNYGVVTALEFDLFPVTSFYGGGIYYSGEWLADLLAMWRDWAPTLPEEATTSVAVQRLPDLPDLPEPLRGAFVVHLRFAYVGPAAEGERLLAPMRAAAPALLDAVAEQPYANVGFIHMDPPDPMPYHDRTTSLWDLTPEAVATLVELTGPESDCPLVNVEIRALGGALDREPAVPNAVPTRGVPFVLFGFGLGGPEQAGRMGGYLDEIVHRLAPWSVEGRKMVNFLSPDEATTPEALRAVYGSQRYARLTEIKKAYDPTNMFRVNHNIQPV
ncbi:FAD-binding oxidoreductase [Asanoa siamensis]|uniref:FAD-linked oxidase n=1 Tax=Asanoa siamensis TaxID=926357 RepID=A0ABQ4CRM5_9ACTN|nr:FAD-binding oxidoreductase [Asanoa siamensis]GIF73948.1 FAD-linked oxidase [Asanoa siamensis]